MRSTVAEMDPLGPERSLSTMIRTHCSPEWREMIRQYCVTIDLEKGEALFREGDTAEHLFIVKRGKIKVFMGRSPPRPPRWSHPRLTVCR